MELSNRIFNDFPIEFKKINSKNISGFEKTKFGKTKNPNGFNVKKSTFETVTSEYINEDLQPLIDLKEKNTTVINAPVGNGKSFAIIQTIKRFYESKEQDYLIVVATPFVSLVEQYVNDIHNDGKIPTEQIYNYSNLGRNQTSYLNKKIQVVTINTLLGNAGEDSYKNSRVKREYLDSLIEDCEKKGRKVVFIYDEIHDSIQNFKEEYVFNLWKWKNVIHKNFIISATFTESSYIVIEYLAELTDKQVHIIEFPRIKRRENQSKLFIHYSSSYRFTNDTPEIQSLTAELLKKGKNIDILCYSKTLAKSLISDKNIGGKLEKKFGKINDCTSENISNQRPINEVPQNRFDNAKCNIGTNFKSGVSITKENHAYVIILPPRSTQGKFKNHYGIFSSGITSIIQAIARQRKPGEIHIISPRPKEFDYKTLKDMSPKQEETFIEFYNKVKHHDSNLKEEDKVKYFDLRKQRTLIESFYVNELHGNVVNGITLSKATERADLARLDFPPYKNFQLNEGEKYLASTYDFFGSDLSAYVTYCAITDQFVNCHLEGFTYKSTLFFEEGKIQKQLNKYYEEYFTDAFKPWYFTDMNFYMNFENFRNRLFSEFEIKLKKKDTHDFETVTKGKNSLFEQQLIRFGAFKSYGTDYYYTADYANRNKDREYTRGQYFRDCIAIASTFEANPLINYPEEFLERINIFKDLSYFRDKMIAKIAQHTKGQNTYSYLPCKPFTNFIDRSEISKFENIIDYFTRKDQLLSNGINTISTRLNGSFEKKVNSFYKILIEDFFTYEIRNTTPRITIGTTPNNQVFPNIEAINLSTTKNIANLIFSAEIAELEYDNHPERDYHFNILESYNLE